MTHKYRDLQVRSRTHVVLENNPSLSKNRHHYAGFNQLNRRSSSLHDIHVSLWILFSCQTNLIQFSFNQNDDDLQFVKKTLRVLILRFLYIVCFKHIHILMITAACLRSRSSGRSAHLNR